ncbi:polysaccharide deacetylase family protein [Bacillus sp. UNC438CL73TsuS30]|uniref:polysaccharide deacetylase family protein n=1 Tax=Bacillus sp. UNC438CL73TsuS30 TaxID=1340434 RepID=UPI00047AA67F|nr:polysaccharide deacetylase [Bacillus sp. UNC438CL73TsuS30]
MQSTGKIALPEGKRVAVNIGVDFDAASVWMGTFKRFSPSYMARGEFGAEVGVPRLLKLFNKYTIQTSFCIPGHTIDTHTDICKEIVTIGHEVCHHGYAHEDPTDLPYEQEEKIMNMGLEALDRIGVKPRGYRSPSWDYSPNTLSILEKHGFSYDSSLMGNDLYPYRPRPVEINEDNGNKFGPPSKIIEIPVSWYLDDFPTQEFVPGGAEGMRSNQELYDRWKSIFDYACEEEEGACYILTVHPQTIGRAHNIQMLEKLIKYMDSRGAWFTTLGSIYDSYVENIEYVIHPE